MKRSLSLLCGLLCVCLILAACENQPSSAPPVDDIPTLPETPEESSVIPDPDSIAQGGYELLAPFYFPTDNSHSGRNSLNEIPYNLLVDNAAVMTWIREEGDYYSTPHTRLTDYPNFYTFILKFKIPVDKLREVLKEKQRIGIERNAQYYTDEEIDILCSLDETRLLAHFASEYAIVIGDRAYPPAWLYLNTPEDYAEAGITPEMVAEKAKLFSVFDFSAEAARAFEEKLSAFTGETVTFDAAE
jgi:hypothetical protein